jgi:hypothetical protein
MTTLEKHGDSVKGIGAQGSWPSTTKLIAWVDNGVGLIPWAPNCEGDEIKMKGMRLRKNREIRNRFLLG